MISLNIEKTLGFISKETVFAYDAQVKAAQEALENGTGKGNDFLGWLHLPSSITPEHLADLKATAQVLRDNCEVVIVAGIGGSYLGARAVIEALSNSFTWLQDKKTAPVIIYAGHNIGEDYLYELTEYLKDKKPDVKVVAVEPETSAVLSTGVAGAHKIQGIGAGFVPDVLDTKVYDEIIPVSNEAAFETGKLIGKSEGVLVGISSGAAAYAAIELAKCPENEGKTIVVLLPDTGDRYLSTPLFQD